jgi:flavorubredoxin
LDTRLTEIADGVHQLTTYLPEMDFGFNQFLVDADEPLLFHTGLRQMFPSVSDTVSRVVPVDRMRWIDTPHVPHAWEAGLLYDETTRTLFCGDLFSRWGFYPPITTDDIAGPAIADEDSSWLSLAPASGSTVRRFADLDVATLAPMHGPAFAGDCRTALRNLADDLDERVAAAS